jgi:hypothetical protein
MEQPTMLEFDPNKLESPLDKAFSALEERDGRSVTEGRWRSILARVEGCRTLGMTAARIFTEVYSWEVEPINAMITQAIDGTAAAEIDGA